MTRRNQHAAEARKERQASYDPARRAAQPARRARCSGYNSSSDQRSKARMRKVPASRRREIASEGGHARQHGRPTR